MDDVLIVGGGPAGRAAALSLDSYSRQVTLVDTSAGVVESDAASGSTAEQAGSPPYTSPQTDCGEDSRAGTVTYLRTTIADVERSRVGFTVHCGDGNSLTARVLLLAEEAVAPAPAITGADRFFGSSLHQCPYCDGWEHRGCKIGVLGSDEAAVELALKLLHWSPRVTLFANGGTVDTSWLKRLEKGRILVVPETVHELEGRDRNLERLRLEGAAAHDCEALFFPSPRRYHSSIVARLGCDVERMAGAVYWRPDGDLIIGGLFVAGRVLVSGEIAASSASEGLKAAQAANDWLLGADLPSAAVTPAARGTRVFRQSGASRRMVI